MIFTPSDIEKKTFSPSKYGYNTEEVDAFLDLISEEISELFKKIADQKALLESTKQQLEDLQTQNAQLKRSVDGGGTRDFEQQASRILTIAQQAADKLVADAQTNAELIRQEADKKAREVIRQALAEKSTELDELERIRQELHELQEQKHTLELTNSRPVSQAPGGAASLSEDFSSIIEAIIQIDATALSDTSRLLSYFADLAPQMQAELSLLRAACELGVIRTLSVGLPNDWTKSRAKALLISGFIEPTAASELVETFAEYIV